LGKAKHRKKEKRKLEDFYETVKDGNAMTASLKKIIDNARDRGEKDVERIRDYIVSAMPPQIRTIKAYPPGPRRAQEIHREIDERFEGEYQKVKKTREITCRKGCAFCCHLLVHITDDEAALLADRVRGGVEIDQEELKRQARLPDDASVWYELPPEKTRCVFLDGDNACKVYEDRPSSCRLNVSVDEPKKCDRTTGSDEHLQFVAFTAEVLASSALTVCRGGPLAACVAKSLGVEV
jgi:Fe-S-cluster containining protein